MTPCPFNSPIYLVPIDEFSKRAIINSLTANVAKGKIQQKFSDFIL